MHAELLQSCLTLRYYGLQTPLSMRFSRQEYRSGFPCPPPRNLPDPWIKPTSLTTPALAGGFFITSATSKTMYRHDNQLRGNTKLKDVKYYIENIKHGGRYRNAVFYRMCQTLRDHQPKIIMYIHLQVMEIKKQQLEPDVEQQTGPKLGKEEVKAVYCHPAYLTYSRVHHVRCQAG